VNANNALGLGIAALIFIALLIVVLRLLGAA
jgi:hypothetical protein